MAGAALAASALLAVPASPAHSATTQDVTFTAKFAKRDRNKRRAGLSLRTTIRIEDKSAPAPLQLTNTLLRFPKGAVVNARFFPKCSPAALRARGPRACPKGSKLGTGSAIGLAPPIVTDPVNTKITLFNGTLEGRNPTIIIYALPDLGPVMTLPGVLRSGRGTPYGYILDTPVPPIKTLPNAPDAAIISVKTQTPTKTVKKGKKKYALVVAPKTCKKTWAYQGEFTFVNGQKATVDGTQKCKK